ncbi:unnamed protein product [Orchesella dallaii]|uniref:G-protein coupled receptors family 1 profile domain-containing protein n=1 Tax=Orchesella dallaii TaxID=48710 RepID=A0ABP1QDW1_9HEXA
MDSNLETDLRIVASLDLQAIEFSTNISSLSEIDVNGEVTLSHLFKKFKAIGIIEIFKSMSINSRNCVIAYVIMFLIGAPGNLYVFLSVGYQLWKRRMARASRIKVLIWHLALADLFVTFVVIPIEVFWRLTIQWYGGDTLCKLIQFFRAFGLYLSSMVIICISMDRFFAIVFPLKSYGGMKRVRNMLCTAWTFSIVFATPQILVFSVQSHPLYPTFLLCTNSHYFPTLNRQILYNLVSLAMMYFAPLLVIIITYAVVFYTISSKSREQQRQNKELHRSSNYLRRSCDASQIMRARNKTMWVSMLIVTVFVLCWTPYVVMTLWYMFDFETAEKLVDPRIKEALFVTAVSNSCLNPIIYGNYMNKFFRCIFLGSCPQVLGNPSSMVVTSTAPATLSRTHHHYAMNSSVTKGIPGRKLSGKSPHNNHPI